MKGKVIPRLILALALVGYAALSQSAKAATGSLSASPTTGVTSVSVSDSTPLFVTGAQGAGTYSITTMRTLGVGNWNSQAYDTGLDPNFQQWSLLTNYVQIWVYYRA